MTDVHDAKTRSYNMSRIRSRDTKPEMLVRRFLFSNGFRYKLHDKSLPGKPDLVLPKYKSVIFVHGCFWHGHRECKYFVIPQTREKWWLAKINRNRELDEINLRKLTELGWKVIAIFECELKIEKRESTLYSLIRKLVT
jgi:DNA mismatch endonuclease (patch repair protein)